MAIALRKTADPRLRRGVLERAVTPVPVETVASWGLAGEVAGERTALDEIDVEPAVPEASASVYRLESAASMPRDSKLPGGPRAAASGTWPQAARAASSSPAGLLGDAEPVFLDLALARAVAPRAGPVAPCLATADLAAASPSASARLGPGTRQEPIGPRREPGRQPRARSLVSPTTRIGILRRIVPALDGQSTRPGGVRPRPGIFVGSMGLTRSALARADGSVIECPRPRPRCWALSADLHPGDHGDRVLDEFGSAPSAIRIVAAARVVALGVRIRRVVAAAAAARGPARWRSTCHCFELGGTTVWNSVIGHRRPNPSGCRAGVARC